MLNALVTVYYNVIVAMSLYYLFGSLTSDLPWATCGHAWNTPHCVDTLPSTCGASTLIFIPSILLNYAGLLIA